MGRTNAEIALEGVRISDIEEVWYDLDRWPEWIDGLSRVQESGGGWPHAGGWVHWSSPGRGRGEVYERVLAHEPRQGFEVAVRDQSIEGEQRVSFTAREEDVLVRVELDYKIANATPVITPAIDYLFVRPRFRDSLRTTLANLRRVMTEPSVSEPDAGAEPLA